MKETISLITGANSGIGYATAEGLARQGHHVIMVSRNKQRGKAAQQNIITNTKNSKVDLLVADLSSQKSIRQLAQQVNERYDKLDVLINNAGGLFSSYTENSDGFEQTFAVNYLAPFLLTHLLMDKVRASEKRRIINVASIMQAKQFDLEDAAQPNSAKYTSMNAYKVSKTAVLMMTYYMAEHLSGSGVTVNTLHPGSIYTPQSARIVPTFLRPLLKLFMQSPEQGASTSLYLASSDEVSNVSGKFFKSKKMAQTVPFSYDSAKQKALYDKSIIWTGVNPSD
ncbi:hypothetical protein BC351_06545 [Paenibacillus ferrarius]|uniref:Short-chain dehydrogenase n=1 Tax=Paenibacillus ferrarius TaxID=1469647 RepID=A0A1V4HFB8_9BACL|nr:SDR family oxidoreductase [Paenibacillus ferrarius]OPH53518.1 hypothetical protein BC351_06545 [Paenibacillus ferrarius]